MNEEEAKTKQCIGPEGCGEFSFATPRPNGTLPRLCAGSACMAWRAQTKAFFSVSWPGGSDGAYIDRKGAPFGYKTLANNTTVSAWIPDDDEPHGYCGLAGKP